MKPFALIGSVPQSEGVLPLAVAYVQLSKLRFHPTSDAMRRARGLTARNSCDTSTQSETLRPSRERASFRCEELQEKL
ncbi:hypothetical protein QQF64_011671 [Cirrhinus molitorella]|uniref:Uncharacterized protein n=2 Tax=Cirrhinus molitorella TaxID=172907 RepID=A0AA88PEV1_9TELE|nr:hypothetical protein Q8A67_019093 [Cirrhinus molitorella]